MLNREEQIRLKVELKSMNADIHPIIIEFSSFVNVDLCGAWRRTCKNWDRLCVSVCVSQAVWEIKFDPKNPFFCRILCTALSLCVSSFSLHFAISIGVPLLFYQMHCLMKKETTKKNRIRLLPASIWLWPKRKIKRNHPR